MSRSNRSERSVQLKGRPKRRAAATTHLFKYQLAQNPNRAEGSALKKALQESLVEHYDSSSQPIATADKNVIRNKNNRVINSSTNSSDVSKASNSTSSTSNASFDDGARKRTRSSTTLSPNSPRTTSPPNKHANITTNGYTPNPISNISKDKCDKDASVLSRSPPLPLNKAIRTYSRSQQVDGHHDLRQQKQSPDIVPRSSTPISKKLDPPDEKAFTKSADTARKSGHELVSKSTQTSKSEVKMSNNQTNGGKTDDEDLRSSTSPKVVDKKVSKPPEPPQRATSTEDHHLKLKRESKNYAYAKMTALKVNTYKSPYNYLKSSNMKKVSPTGVHNNGNKNSVKTYPKVKKPNIGILGLNCSVEMTAGKKSLSPNTREPNHLYSSETKKSSTNSIPKHLNAASRGLKNDHPSNTINLSSINLQSHAGVSVTKKCIAPGSWSLLGVPEEKVIYLRDDEPPQRLICYPAIRHVEGDVIQVRDSVLLRSGAKTTDLPYIAKVCAFWEDAETGGVMMSLFWYYRPEHIEDGRKPHHLTDEIFASRHRDVDSVECIEDKCYVLTFNEYCRYKKRVKMEQVGATWSLTEATIPVSNESYPRRNRIPDSDVNPELVFCCRQIYDSRMKRLIKNPLINTKYGHI